MLSKCLHRCASNLLRQTLLLSLRSIIQKLLLILELDRIFSNQCGGVSCSLILNKSIGSSITSSILVQILHHLAFPLDFDDALILRHIGASHLSHPAEYIVK